MNKLLNKIIKRSNLPEKFVPKIPSGKRIYCIGDIHGRNDLLQQLIDNIVKDAYNYQGQKTAVFLGDYIDRGMNSKDVLDILVDTDFLPDFEKVFLCGNHEQTLINFLSHDSAILKEWWRFGAQTTFYSYGIPIMGIPSEANFLKLQMQLKDAIPTIHLNFFQGLKQSFLMGDYFFTHAGIKPGVMLDHQNEKDLYWIREEFLASERMHDKMIVHGHSVTSEPVFLPNRIGIDTGAYMSGNLTCLVLENDEQRILTNTTIFEAEAEKPVLSLLKPPIELEKRSVPRNDLADMLNTFAYGTSNVTAAALLSDQGEVIAQALIESSNADQVRDMIAAQLSVSKQTLALFSQGEMERLILQGEQGYSIFINTKRNTFLLVITNQNIKLGQILYDMCEIINKMESYL